MNFFISVIGWAVWTIAEMEITRRRLDSDGNPQTNFSWYDYRKSHRFIWIGSFLCIPLLLWLGYAKMNLDPLEPITGAKVGWHDLYYLGSGFAFEFIIFIIMFATDWLNKKKQQLNP